MIVCTKCGFENEDSDTFCGSCAGFLEWSGQKVQEAVPEPEPEAEPEVEEEAHPGFIERVKERIGIGDKDEEAPSAEEVPVAVSNGAEASETAAATASEPPPLTTPSAPAAVATAATAAPPAPGPSVSAPSAPGPTVSTAPSAPIPAGAAAAPLAAAAATSSPPAEAGAPPAPGSATAAPPEAKSAPAAAPTVAAAAAATATAATAAATKTEPVQPAAVQPAAVQPQAVKPQAVKTRPTPKQKQPSTRVVNPGDLVCGQCGEGNDPKRKFCRRCGASLQEAVVFALPWYQRWWRALTRKRVRAAGERPKNRRRLVGGSGPGLVWSVVRLLLVIAVVVVVIVALVSHPFRHRISTYYHDILNDVHPRYAAIHPPQQLARATSQQIGFPPSATIDGAVNSHWATGSANDGKGATLILRMGSPTNIDKIGFLNGNQDGAPSNTQSTFATEPAVKDIRVVFAEIVPVKNALGQTVNTVETKVKNYTLKDNINFQTFNESYKGVTLFELTILSVYPSTAVHPGHNASLAEVEFFKKS
jgi:hypothetical protein